ncbi:hypothetical protein OFO07_02670 [Campylobacter sp. JMF_06 NA1]|uniref:hypothetical protein n=1 Tax=Campylobacter sp. JMF_06 NA1 TaxID=2983823 RepID=UPI0022E9C69E|nr:hypothetical protein [Campylobacter sp. JMF_06 NA1]MDA3077830.1 hypothetical protein [Campylobacter sp. JMF_06 NA1]
MENFENWNKNVINKNSNQRDYDKEPIIIKNPYEFFLANLFFFSLFGTMFVLLIYVDYMNIENINNIFLWAFFGVGFLHIVATFYYYIIKNKCETKFTNKTIEFSVNNETKIVKNLIDLDRPIERTFRLFSPLSLSSIIIFYIPIFFIFALVKMAYYLIVCYVIGLFLNCLFKFVFHLVLGGKLRDFSLFPAFIFDYGKIIGKLSLDGMDTLKYKYHMVYIIKKQDYLDLQKYFSDKKHINLNLVKKKF